ncbi:hypothetical protein A0O34_01355 [Chryseobacterium glaciei]|uniref:Uncharacterized protein n=2 Tax=Chryseobacterium glaciei TaxID=1685010 RepID=A0A172XQV2_9FLAO|nr:hypothetical protein A0O34_01355 [Chryseobacterium glaciei]
MVNKSVLRKLSDYELNKYIKEGNRFTPEAVQMAFEILEERGRTFTTEEKISIQNIIQNKKESEAAKKNEEIEDWKDHITTDSSAIRLYSRALLLSSSFFLGTFYGAFLLSLNFIKLKKYASAVFTMFFGIIYIPFQYYTYRFLIGNGFANSSRYSPEILPLILGPLILIIIWVTMMPKRLAYRTQSFVFPVILAIAMLILIFINYQGWFSSYFLLRFTQL